MFWQTNVEILLKSSVRLKWCWCVSRDSLNWKWLFTLKASYFFLRGAEVLSTQQRDFPVQPPAALQASCAQCGACLQRWVPSWSPTRPQPGSNFKKKERKKLSDVRNLGEDGRQGDLRGAARLESETVRRSTTCGRSGIRSGATAAARLPGWVTAGSHIILLYIIY